MSGIGGHVRHCDRAKNVPSDIVDRVVAYASRYYGQRLDPWQVRMLRRMLIAPDARSISRRPRT